MIEIEQLRITVPGISEADASWMGEYIATKLSQNIPPQIENNHIDELNAQIAVESKASRHDIAEHIANQLIQRLKWA